MSKLKTERTGRKQPVLLIHGLGTRAAVWDRLAPSVPDRLTVDLFGHGGNTDFPATLDIQYTVDELHETLLSKKLKGLRLVGHGLGGIIAMELAGQHPEQVSSIVLIDTPSWQTGWKVAHRIMLHVVRDDYEESVKHHIESLCKDERLAPHLIRMTRETEPRAYYLYLRDMFAHDYRDHWKDMIQPVLGVFTRSLVKNHRALSKLSRKFGYNSLPSYEEYWLPDSGHFAMLEQSGSLFQAMDVFWQGV